MTINPLLMILEMPPNISLIQIIFNFAQHSKNTRNIFLCKGVANFPVALILNPFYTTVMSITNPTQALEEYIGEQYIEWLMQYIPQEIESWPIIPIIKTAKPKPEKIKKFLIQIFLANESFLGSREGDPGLLRFAIANLSESNDPLAENALEILEKRRTEELQGHSIEKGIIHTPARDEWIRLLKATGATDEEIDRAEAKESTRNYIADLSEVYSTAEWQTAIGAMAAQERAIMEESKAVLALVKNNLSLSDKELHVLSERAAGHRLTEMTHLLDKVVFDSEAKELVWQGVVRQQEIRRDFLTGLEKYLQ
jgi:hypothetical protein